MVGRNLSTTWLRLQRCGRYLTCDLNYSSYYHVGSPLIWRELIDRGGRGFLIGGPAEFNQYIEEYYGVSPDIYDDELAGRVAEENLNTVVQDKKETELNQPADPINICSHQLI